VDLSQPGYARRRSSKPLMSIQEVARCFCVSKQAAWRWVQLGRLKARKLRRGGVLRVSRSEVARFAKRTHRRLAIER